MPTEILHGLNAKCSGAFLDLNGRVIRTEILGHLAGGRPLEVHCGEEIQSLSLDEEKPRLVSEEGLTRELGAIKAENVPAEGQVRPGFGTYRSLLLVSTLAGGAQGRGDETGWLLVFKEGRLLGKTAVRLEAGEATTYADGATKRHQLPSRVARLLYPTEW
ncbi:hypothetical protein [Desulfofundulus salinus]|uniref:Uncharacterized protein n=1 Tax=Desulfofundulus salinus TaxID=2419843 RepID=A0A494X3T2_9FIRM|nr:hypothetical protein [Desulfofundulus salinum]RKO67825.1 hypothetical protein D7024_13335 [Desulfofundulus salinum]